MLGFLEWVAHERKKKDKEKKNERSTSQASPVDWNKDHQGEAARSHPQEPPEGVFIFTEPRV